VLGIKPSPTRYLLYYIFQVHLESFLNTNAWVFVRPAHTESPGVTDYYKGACTPMFTAALFKIAKLWKQTRCPITDEWIKKM
jgi:hypothetical protein